MHKINQVYQKPLIPLHPLEVKKGAAESKKTRFQDILSHKITSTRSLKFSKHATERIRQRDIQFSNVQLQRIEDTVDKAAAKGAHESLLVINGVAMVVNVSNRTVVTCVGAEEAGDKIFTNIDSAMLL